MTLYDYNINGVEHPRGTIIEKTEDGGVRIARSRAVDGAPVWHFEYTAEEWDEITKAVKAKKWQQPPEPVVIVDAWIDPAPRAPKPDPVPEDTTDPAPRAPAPDAQALAAHDEDLDGPLTANDDSD